MDSQDGLPVRLAELLPGCHVLVLPERIAETRPDAIVILPWNVAKEIAARLAYTDEWGPKFIVPIPSVTVLEPHRIAS